MAGDYRKSRDEVLVILGKNRIEIESSFNDFLLYMRTSYLARLSLIWGILYEKIKDGECHGLPLSQSFTPISANLRRRGQSAYHIGVGLSHRGRVRDEVEPFHSGSVFLSKYPESGPSSRVGVGVARRCPFEQPRTGRQTEQKTGKAQAVCHLL